MRLMNVRSGRAMALVLFCAFAAVTLAARRFNELDEEGASAFRLPPGVRVARDIAYGPDPAQRFDVYYGEHAKNAPVIFMVHGGGWRTGDKAARSVVANKVAHWVPRGYVLVSTNYRLLPKASPLTQADDVAAAIAAAQSKIARYGGDPARFVLMGHSAGAHLVALVESSPEIAARAHATRGIGAVILDSAALDVPSLMEKRHLPLYDAAFGSNPRQWELASPFHALSGGAPPMLLVCSSRRMQSCAQATEFASKGRALRERMRVLEQDRSHREINVDAGTPGEYTDSIDEFLASLR